MDIFDGVKAALRRWYVLIPLLAVTAYLAFATYTDTKPTYNGSIVIAVTTSSVVTSVPVPSGSPTVDTSNALIGNGGTSFVTNLLMIGLQQPAVAQQVSEAGGSSAYSVDVYQRPQSQGQLPILTISVTDPNAAKVSTSLVVLKQAADNTLASIQSNAGVPSERAARTFVVQPATGPTRSVPSTLRSAAIVAIVGFLVAVTFSGALDAVIVRRGRRRGSTPDLSEGPPAVVVPEPAAAQSSPAMAVPEHAAPAVGRGRDARSAAAAKRAPVPQPRKVARRGRHADPDSASTT